MVKKKRKNSFYEAIRNGEKKEFPEFTNFGVCANPINNYAYFSPSWHFRRGLLTEELVDDIKNNDKSILSVGSGAGYLERYLTKNLGVKKQQITLSDKNPVMPGGFEQFIFDMYGEWPDFGKKFDYIIFPQSTLLNLNFQQDTQRQIGLYHIIESSLKTMKPVGQIRMNGNFVIEENTNTVKSWLERNHTDSRLTSTQELLVVERGYKK